MHKLDLPFVSFMCSISTVQITVSYAITRVQGLSGWVTCPYMRWVGRWPQPFIEVQNETQPVPQWRLPRLPSSETLTSASASRRRRPSSVCEFLQVLRGRGGFPPLRGQRSLLPCRARWPMRPRPLRRRRTGRPGSDSGRIPLAASGGSGESTCRRHWCMHSPSSRPRSGLSRRMKISRSDYVLSVTS